jgi:hypothetical protein
VVVQGVGPVPQPRVLPVLGTRVGRVYVPDWPGHGRPTPPTPEGNAPVVHRWIAWRLLAGNGWEIARSADVFPDRSTCSAALAVLTRTIARAEWTTTRGVRPDAWSWEMALDGELVAVASRFYKLRRECESAVRTFLAVLPVALLPRDWSSSRTVLSRQDSSSATDERTASSGRRYCTDVQNAHLRAATGIIDTHSGHSFVGVGSSGVGL